MPASVNASWQPEFRAGEACVSHFASISRRRDNAARLASPGVTFCRLGVTPFIDELSRPSHGCTMAADPIDWRESPAIAPVAQLDRASGYEPEGRVFESPRAHHKTKDLWSIARFGR